MKHSILSVLTACALLLSASCGKQYNSKPNYNKAGLNALFKELRSKEQHFVVTAGTTVHISGKEGTSLVFSPTSFKDAAGNIITSGMVDVTIVEMYKGGSMLANRASTMCGTRPLQSTGQINITATLNGQPVYSNGYKISFKQPVAMPTPMALFYGNTNNTDSIVTWETPRYDSGTMASSTTYDNGYEAYVYNFCGRFGWVNSDALYEFSDSLTSVSVSFPDASNNPANTQLYIYLPQINSLMASTVESGGNINYIERTHTMKILNWGESQIVPIGWEYKLIAVCRKGDFYWTYHSEGTVTQNMHLMADLQPLTAKNLLAYLDSL